MRTVTPVRSGWPVGALAGGAHGVQPDAAGGGQALPHDIQVTWGLRQGVGDVAEGSDNSMEIRTGLPAAIRHLVPDVPCL